MATRNRYEQEKAKNISEAVYKDVVFPFLTKLGISSTLLQGLSPLQCKAKRIRNGEKYKHEDHTYTINPAGIFTANFDRVIAGISNNTLNYNPLLGTYFASRKGVYAACIAPAIEIARMLRNKKWQSCRNKSKVFTNTYEPKVRFKVLPFDEVRYDLSIRQDIPFLFWSAKRNVLAISRSMYGNNN